MDESDSSNKLDKINDDDNIIGYYYEIKLHINKTITKYYYFRNGIDEININQVNTLLRKKVKFILVPIFKVVNKTMSVSFLVKKMIIC